MPNHRRLPILVATVAAVLLFVGASRAAETWTPLSFADESTLEFFTVNAEGEEHWATVWFVLVDGDAFLRLGERAETRIRENIHSPVIRVRIAGQVFEDMAVEEVPDRNTEIAEAMAAKYWSAFLMPHLPERYTARLVPPAPPEEPGSDDQ